MYRLVYNQQDKKTGAIILVFLICIVSVYIFIFSPLKKKKLNKNARYTVGKIINIIEHTDADDPEYEFIVKGLKYKSREARLIQGVFNFDKSYIGKRYFIMYDSLNPVNCCLLPTIPVPDSIANAPFSGWVYLPLDNE